MLKLPADGDELPPLVIPGSDHEPEIEAEPEPELVSDDPDHPGMVRKRRRKNPREEEVFDETFAHKEELSPRMVRILIGSVALVGLILLAALLWPRGDRPVVVDTTPLPPVEEVDPGPSEEDLAAAREVVPATLVDEELVPIYREFLEAKTPEEMAKWVLHPELTLPRIRKFYEAGYEPAGLSKIVWGMTPMKTEGAVAVVLMDGNFVRHRLYAIDEDGWKIDWESWSGWSEMPWEEFMEEKPTEAVDFRVVVSDVSYYNFGFISESQWSCYRLSSGDGEYSIFGYVPRAGLLDARLKSLEGVNNRLYLLKLRYPEDPESDNQVLIEDILSDSWFKPVEN